jgi:hypothetical protein
LCLFASGLALNAQLPLNLTVSASTPPPYLASQTITTDTVSPFVVNSGANVTFQAGVEIDLLNGFHAVIGSAFHALIAPPTGLLTITGPSLLPVGTLTVTYLPATVTASGGTPGYTWSASGLPPGLSISSGTGVVSGTPNTAGTFNNIIVTVTDSTLATAHQSYTMTICGSSREYIPMGGRVISVINCGS